MFAESPPKSRLLCTSVGTVAVAHGSQPWICAAKGISVAALSSSSLLLLSARCLLAMWQIANFMLAFSASPLLLEPVLTFCAGQGPSAPHRKLWTCEGMSEAFAYRQAF